MKSQSAKRYPPELRERAVRMLLEHRDEYDSEPDAIRAISSKIGCHYDTLRAWLCQYKNDVRGGVECRFQSDMLWLTQASMAELYDKDVRTINEDLINTCE